MSLLRTVPSSAFDPATTNTHHSSLGSNNEYSRTRPVLKRSRTPYTPTSDSKRRRTSPTGAFSKLSISNRPIRSSITIAPQPILQNPTSTTATMGHDQQQEIKMRSIYSAYEIEPDRIFIESLSDDLNNSTPSSPSNYELEEDQLRIHPELSQKLITQHAINSIFSNQGQRMIPRTQALPHRDNQLVLYRKPDWPISTILNTSNQEDLSHQNCLEFDRFKEIQDDANEAQEQDHLNLDSMDLD